MSIIIKEAVPTYFESKESLCEAFANEVTQSFVQHLRVSQAMSEGDYAEYELWKRISGDEPTTVKKNTYNGMMAILDKRMRDYDENLFLKFKSRRFISIRWNEGFYDHLLHGSRNVKDGESIRGMVPINVEYLVDRRKLSITKFMYKMR